MSDSGPLFERDREVEVLEGLVRSALGGDAVLALVEGPAGIGKSRLLAEARERARAAGFRVLAARGSDLEQELPYGVVRQLFESLLLEPERRERWLRGSAGGAARVFAPPQDEDHAVGPGSFGMLHALFWLTVNAAADGPLCLVIDDLRWCDRASLRFIAYLEHRLEGLGVLVVAATRMEEAGSESQLVFDIIEDPAAVLIRPLPLSEGGAAQMVRDRLAEDAERRFCAACHHATGGNPLLLRELVKTLQAENIRPDAAHADAIRKVGPRAVSRTVLLRLSRLPSDAVTIARAVAVLGDGASLPATAALAGLDEGKVAEATHTLVAAEILRAEAPLGFVHAIVGDAVYLELSLSERELLHQHAAKELATLGAAPEVVAGQLLLVPSRGDPWVAMVMRDAGLLAMRRGDADSAVSYLRRALEEGVADEDRLRLLWELGAAEARVDSEASAERLREVQGRLDDPLQRALVADVLARSLLWTGPAHEAVTVAQHAIVELKETHPDQRRALEAIELYAVFFGGARVAHWETRLARVRADGVPEHLGAKMLAAVAAWDWALNGGSARECSAFAQSVLADGALIARDPGFGAAVAGAALALADHDEALRVWEEAISASRRLGSAPYVCSVNLWRGWTWLRRGELAEAEASLREANEQLRRGFGNNGPSLAYGAAFLARTLIERGDLSGARRALAGRGRPNPQSDGDWLVNRAGIELLLAEGRWEEALAAGERHSPPPRGGDNPAWAPWRSLAARALDGLGRHDDALALLIIELDAARRWGAPGALAHTLRLLGTLRQNDDHELLREAVAVTEASPARLEHAKALTALGSAMRRSNQRSDSRDPLGRGLELALRCGATALAETARTELYAAGGRPRREALSGPASLTPSERRIANLAAQGQTTRDIAQSLYVTPRTVEGHLTNIYRKLGVSTRTALPGALAGQVSA
ncbi:helix-turn-helix transcriptional regulator [Leekyejoonella antrihumi]|uniref:helix-turn-helix transcriptional regulator n=1 Tax=Leekyejoonella antrihumi TaxID=1660198 RepID=UPI001646B593|nr:LuxR family transcriptional regulator [Leekyejoonella antrihumi]